MRRKRWSYLIACVVLAGGLAAPGTYTKVYAQDYENVEYVTSVSELRDSMDEADVVNSADVMDRGADVDAAAMYSSESADIYSLRRIILYTDEVPETYGATTVICYDKYDYYVLGYDTEEATRQAYEKLHNKHELSAWHSPEVYLQRALSRQQSFCREKSQVYIPCAM